MRLMPSQAIPIVQAMWRHRWLAVGTAWLVCTAGWVASAFVPTKYESTARVYLNADPLLTPLLRGLAADTDPGRHLDFMQRTLLSRPNLEQLIRLTDLDKRRFRRLRNVVRCPSRRDCCRPSSRRRLSAATVRYSSPAPGRCHGRRGLTGST